MAGLPGDTGKRSLDEGIEAFDQLGVRDAVFGREQAGGGDDRVMGCVRVSHRDRLSPGSPASKTDVERNVIRPCAARRSAEPISNGEAVDREKAGGRA